jgi:hypothetical protein
VIGVQHDRNAIDLGQRTHMQRARDRAPDRRLVIAVVEGLSTIELRAAVRELNHDGRLGLPRGFESGVGGVRADAIDGGQGAVDFLAMLEECDESVAGDDPGVQFQGSHGFPSVVLCKPPPFLGDQREKRR